MEPIAYANIVAQGISYSVLAVVPASLLTIIIFTALSGFAKMTGEEWRIIGIMCAIISAIVWLIVSAIVIDNNIYYKEREFKRQLAKRTD